MAIIRIYLTEHGPEGYYEGCSCCSAEEYVKANEIQDLINRLEAQVTELKMLQVLTSAYGETQLGIWYQQHENIRVLTRDLENAIKYRDNPEIEGTAYKHCFDRMDEISFQLEQALRQYRKIPSEMRKFLGKYYENR